MTKGTDCYLCRYSPTPETDLNWDLPSLTMIMTGFHVCARHKKFCEERIPVLEKERSVFKVKISDPERFLPKPIKEEKSFYEREPGEEG